ncbi:FimB/Mfa2 family fimbrial subunit [Prevotella herbatica]|uniref:FimB/Mfa2 family fimbrial subunit n=1 Tax=Prevotella herbatica TaxID=2801997 RepID=A0ABN6ELV3_9BACT|nr:FimB/Mfa2 family fimbrial subunit [Prevotella herbatica]BCS85668.1 FimB/Mfa2 family fimbrial subunit [Prevotella herbatica]
MTKLINTLILIILLFTQTSCERVSFDKSDIENKDGFELNFHVRNLDTRGIVDVSKVCNKINFAVYDSIGDRVKSISQSSDKDNDFGTIKVSLPEGNYKVVVLAHSGSTNASTTNMNRITFNGKVTDTFVYSEDINVKGNSDYQMTLKRCVAKILFTVKDKVPENVKQIKFFYTGGSSTLDGASGMGCVNSRQTEIRDVGVEARADSSVYELYTFPQDATSCLNITVSCLDGEGNTIYERMFEDVNISLCGVTTCTGNLFSADANSSTKGVVLKADDEWIDGGIYKY